MSVDRRARAGSSWPCSTPSRSRGLDVELPAHRRDRGRGEAPKLRLGSKRSRPRWPIWRSTGLRRAQRQRGFSGGEKKRHEILQLSLLKPKIAILGETDSGWTSTHCASSARASTGCRGGGCRRPAHHALHPDPALHPPQFVHVFVDGRIVGPAARNWPTRLGRMATCGSPGPLRPT